MARARVVPTGVHHRQNQSVKVVCWFFLALPEPIPHLGTSKGVWLVGVLISGCQGGCGWNVRQAVGRYGHSTLAR
jgi:hypothetical protein